MTHGTSPAREITTALAAALLLGGCAASGGVVEPAATSSSPPNSPGRWVEPEDYMFAEAEQAAADPEAGEVSVESDPVDGHPTAISVDHDANAIDDEGCYEITEYRAAG